MASAVLSAKMQGLAILNFNRTSKTIASFGSVLEVIRSVFAKDLTVMFGVEVLDFSLPADVMAQRLTKAAKHVDIFVVQTHYRRSRGYCRVTYPSTYKGDTPLVTLNEPRYTALTSWKRQGRPFVCFLSSSWDNTSVSPVPSQCTHVVLSAEPLGAVNFTTSSGEREAALESLSRGLSHGVKLYVRVEGNQDFGAAATAVQDAVRLSYAHGVALTDIRIASTEAAMVALSIQEVFKYLADNFTMIVGVHVTKFDDPVLKELSRSSHLLVLFTHSMLRGSNCTVTAPNSLTLTPTHYELMTCWAAGDTWEEVPRAVHRRNSSWVQTFETERSVGATVRPFLQAYPGGCAAVVYADFEDATGSCRPRYSRLRALSALMTARAAASSASPDAGESFHSAYAPYDDLNGD
ncbi:hypothetical protein V5799_007281 [Amblyomma americanum]|uniref:Uncharacterized protein n=1 Tax=Amblyomma americanum TaxID=6943 RepID=A0AAQ4DTZ3_AMBAM